MRLQPPRGLHLWLGSWCRHRHTHYYATRAFGSFVWHYHCMADNAKTGVLDTLLSDRLKRPLAREETTFLILIVA